MNEERFLEVLQQLGNLVTEYGFIDSKHWGALNGNVNIKQKVKIQKAKQIRAMILRWKTLQSNQVTGINTQLSTSNKDTLKIQEIEQEILSKLQMLLVRDTIFRECMESGLQNEAFQEELLSGATLLQYCPYSKSNA